MKVATYSALLGFMAAGYLTVSWLWPRLTPELTQQSSINVIALAEKPDASWNDVITADLLVVFVGEQTCPFSNLESVRSAVIELGEAVQQEADSRDLRFSLIGISADSRADTGLDFLRNMAYFDGIISGSLWSDFEGMEAISLQLGRSAPVPQLLVFEKISTYPSEMAIDMLPERGHELRFRLTGADEIEYWMAVRPWIPSI